MGDREAKGGRYCGYHVTYTSLLAEISTFVGVLGMGVLVASGTPIWKASRTIPEGTSTRVCSAISIYSVPRWAIVAASGTGLAFAVLECGMNRRVIE